MAHVAFYEGVETKEKFIVGVHIARFFASDLLHEAVFDQVRMLTALFRPSRTDEKLSNITEQAQERTDNATIGLARYILDRELTSPAYRLQLCDDLAEIRERRGIPQGTPLQAL